MKDILVITKENCPMCKRLRKELDRSDIVYRTLDAENDIEGMAYVQFYALGDSILPRVIINEELLPPHERVEETVDDVLKAINKAPFKGIECSI